MVDNSSKNSEPKVTEHTLKHLKCKIWNDSGKDTKQALAL